MPKKKNNGYLGIRTSTSAILGALANVNSACVVTVPLLVHILVVQELGEFFRVLGGRKMREREKKK